MGWDHLQGWAGAVRKHVGVRCPRSIGQNTWASELHCVNYELCEFGFLYFHLLNDHTKNHTVPGFGEDKIKYCQRKAKQNPFQCAALWSL